MLNLCVCKILIKEKKMKYPKQKLTVLFLLTVLMFSQSTNLSSDEIQRIKEIEAKLGMSLEEFHNKVHNERIARETDTTRKIRVGNIIPDFELANLDNENEIISMQSLRGKYVLIDIWGTWCYPCIREIPYLEAAYNRFKDKNFTIYSIAGDDPETVKRFRENSKHKMPWLHSAVISRHAPIINLLEVMSYPTHILVSPDGEILRNDFSLRASNLEKTLEKYLEP